MFFGVADDEAVLFFWDVGRWSWYVFVAMWPFWDRLRGCRKLVFSLSEQVLGEVEDVVGQSAPQSDAFDFVFSAYGDL